jgi:RNA polymerase sigma-70 factor, ECF subfamily
MQEYEAITCLKQGDISGLETLVKIHQLKAAHTAYLIVRDYELAEDVVEDAFLRAYERINQFDIERPFGPWFLRIVINIAKRTAFQRERYISLNNPNTDEEITLENILADITPGLEELAEKADLRNAVWVALGKLTLAQRATIVQRYYLDLSEKEIAANSDSPLGTIKWRLHTAREHLRDWLRPLWYTDAHSKHTPDKEMKP